MSVVRFSAGHANAPDRDLVAVGRTEEKVTGSDFGCSARISGVGAESTDEGFESFTCNYY